LKQEIDRQIGGWASVRKKVERYRVIQRQKERERNPVRILRLTDRQIDVQTDK
jgi:hypothetical protein